jgi:sec-independent protein translocase protein TatA
MGLDNPLHIAFLVVILLLLFGARRLPEIGRSLGSGMREFKQAVTGDDGASRSVAPPALTQAAAPPPQAPAAQAVAQAPAAAPSQPPAEPTRQA